jgi:hypothetical protein
MKKTAVEILSNLDIRHQKLRKSYDSCYDQKCADMNNKLMGPQSYEISDNGTKQKLFIQNSDVTLA